MKTLKQSLEAKGLRLLRKIHTPIPWIEGSLVSTSRFCRKKNCICHQGEPKQPVLYVTWKEKGKTISLYVPRRLATEVTRWVQNHKKLKDLIREISEIQKQIILLRGGWTLINARPEYLKKQREIDGLKEESQRLRQKHCYQARKGKKGFFGSSTLHRKLLSRNF